MDDRRISRLGLGCSRIGSFNNPLPDREALRLVQSALDMGVRVLDTANVYGQGDSERVIGRALKGRRDDAFVVTKCGMSFSPRMRLLLPLKPLLRPLLRPLLAWRRGGGGAAPGVATAQRAAALRRSFAPAALIASLEGSLRRLGLDDVDGLLLHSPDAAALADPAIAATLARLKQAGRVRHFGVSCDDADSLHAALAMPGLTMLQLPWPLVADGQANALAARGLMVQVREVIRLQPALAPEVAVAQALSAASFGTVLVGTHSQAHLSALAAAAAR
jgi:aryl-alcohol dehydrogenase-like predicted oxidoreductase